MKVLVVHNRYRAAQSSGETTVFETECKLLEQAGCDVATIEPTSDDIHDWPAGQKALLPVRVVWSRKGQRALVEGIRRESPDVVHFHNTFPLLSPAALRVPRSLGVPSIQTLHNFRPFCANAMLIRNGKICETCLTGRMTPGLMHGCYRDSRTASAPIVVANKVHSFIRTYDAVTHYLTPSAFTRQKYIEAGWPAHRMSVKYNTVEDSPPGAWPRGNDFLVVSRLSREKGIDRVIESWMKFAGDAPGNARLIIVGSGPDEARLRSLADGRNDVVFVGNRTNLEARELMRQARALVVASTWYEVFPRVIVEAFAAALPVIATDIGALGEIVDHETTGLTFALGDAEALAALLRRVSLEPHVAARLGLRARRRYEERYEPGVVTRSLLDEYQRATDAFYAGRA